MFLRQKVMQRIYGVCVVCVLIARQLHYTTLNTAESRLEQSNYFTWNLTKVFMVLMLVVQYYVRSIDF